MKRLWLIPLLAFIASPLAAQEDLKSVDAKAAPPQTPKDQASYVIGLSVARDLQRQGLDNETLNPRMLARGIVDAMTGVDSALTQEQIMAAMQQFEKTMQAKRLAMQAEQEKVQAERQQLGVQAQADGEVFLAANGRKPDVKVLPSGLQYKVIAAGAGASPSATDTVKVHYKGTLINGKVFDSSLGGEPVTFAVNEVIPGWTEALQLMKVGAKWQLFIPAKLAYGERGAGKDILPNSALVFEVELLDVVK